MRRAVLLGLAGGLCLIPVLAQKATPKVDPTDMPLESLLTMEVTTASKFPEKLSGAASIISVVTQDELRRFGAMTLREALERVPGLQASSNVFNDRSMIAARGDQLKVNGGHILILINGRPVREIMDGGIVSDLMQSFPVSLLERIEVIRGPGSVLYGTNAFSGVINLITKKAVGQSAAFRGYTVDGRGGASGEMLLERGKLNLVAAGQARFEPPLNTGFWSTPPGVPVGLRTNFSRISVGDQGPGGYIGVNYKGWRLMGAYTDWQTGYFLNNIVGDTRYRRGFANIGYTLSPSAKWDISLDATYTRSWQRSSGVPNNQRASSETVLEWTNVVKATSRDQITFGALFNYAEGRDVSWLDRSAAPFAVGSRPSAAFYGQIDHQLNDAVKLVAGFQSNKSGPLELSTVPRVGLVWSLTSKLHVKALYGRAFRAPSIAELTLDFSSLKGNLNLKPEQVRTLDAGISYQANRLLVGLNYFDSRQSQIISINPRVFPLLYENLDAVRLSGVEFESKYYLTERLFAFGSLFHSNRGPTIRVTPPWTVSSGVSYQTRKAYTLTLSDVFSSAVPGYAASVNPLPVANHIVNAHGRLELSHVLGYRAKGFALFAHGNNLLQQKVWFGDGNVSLNDTFPFRRGRSISYGLEVSLARE